MASENADSRGDIPLTRLAYTVYGVARRVKGNTLQREELESLAHAALRAALLDRRRPALHALIEIRDRLTRKVYAGLRSDDLQALQRALRQLPDTPDISGRVN